MKLLNKSIVNRKIGYGGLSLKYMDKGEGRILVRAIYDWGYRLFDTAPSYGHSEELIGNALYDVPRDSFILSTKTHKRDFCGMKKDLQRSLKRLRTRYIDIYMLHTVNEKEIDKITVDVFRFLHEFKSKGIIKEVGFSLHYGFELAKRYIETGLFSYIMVPYNFIEEGNEEIIEYATDNGLEVMTIKSLADGQLSPSLALEWLGEKRRCDYDFVPIVGTSSLDHFLEANDRMLKPSLSLEKVQEGINKEKEQKVICRRCDRCIEDCPRGIEPTWLVQYRILFKQYGEKRIDEKAKQRIDRAFNYCDDCGRCAKRCPAGINLGDLVGFYAETLKIWMKGKEESIYGGGRH